VLENNASAAQCGDVGSAALKGDSAETAQYPAKQWVAEEFSLPQKKQRSRERRLQNDRICIREVIRGDQQRTVRRHLLHADQPQREQRPQ
jgi:hypothetical protein